MDEARDDRDEEGEGCQDHVGKPDGVGELRGRRAGGNEDEGGPDLGSDGGCERVEASAEIEARGRSLRFAECSNVWIDGYLQERESAAYHEQREEEDWIGDDDGGRNEEQEAEI